MSVVADTLKIGQRKEKNDPVRNETSLQGTNANC